MVKHTFLLWDSMSSCEFTSPRIQYRFLVYEVNQSEPYGQEIRRAGRAVSASIASELLYCRKQANNTSLLG